MTSKPWGALPLSRINTIMRSSSDAEHIGKVSSHMMTKAAELFIKTLTKEGYRLTKNGKKLDYKHVAEVVNRDDRYEFLKDIMPKKITVAEYKKIVAKQQQDDATSSDDESGSESSTDASDKE
ncbi:CBFD NFYB HMF domain containing protein [Asbolus verrucosus]|uniref:CBFD NFYB HMF domain containing protein n=1 Tax=Asbolus verrucosus TaxID=1661398 RepID=A0A482VM54_ASBVE|nr:CBFD NFYB HMF domain containing protein [Asbolus verrucosus]